MSINANSLTVNLLVTAFMALMVFVMPWADRKICAKLGLNLNGGISKNKRADALLRLRQSILLGIFLIYLAAIAWIVFFSRSASSEYLVHVALFQDLTNAVQIDFGILNVIPAIFREGPVSALRHIRVISPANIAQVYMNVMLFIPMGYLLPYVFSWFRAKPETRPLPVCFLASLAIENIQLISKRGFYDADDLISNTLGGFIGQVLFISVAYVVTHPNWRKDLKSYRRWKRNAKKRTLYPFARRIGLSRTTLLATREEDVWDFYVNKLGFRLKKQIVPLNASGTDFLLEMGKSQVEIRCSNREEALPPQSLTISAKRIVTIKKRLEANGIQVGSFEQDVYTGARMLRFSGPDGVQIKVLEA